MRQEKIIAIIFVAAAMIFSAVTYSSAHQVIVIHPSNVDYQVGGLSDGAPEMGGAYHSTVPAYPAFVPQSPQPVDPNDVPRNTKYKFEHHNKIQGPGGGSYSSGTHVVVVRGFHQVRATSYGQAYHTPVVQYTVYRMPVQ